MSGADGPAPLRGLAVTGAMSVSGDRPFYPPYRWPAAPVTLSAERNAKA